MKHAINRLFLLLGLVVAFLFFRDELFFNSLIVAICFSFFILLSIGVLWLRANYFLPAIHKVEKPYVLLTFDDGPNPGTTPKILKTLQENHIKAMFFLIGNKAEKYPEVVEQILKEGHLIGNHTYSHPNLFALLSSKKVQHEIIKGNDVLKKITGKENEWFRPPIGTTNPIIASVIKAMNMKVVGWNKRSFDTVLKNPSLLKKRILFLTKPGSIILLHDNLPQTAEMLPSYIKCAKENGIVFADKECINSILK